MRGRSPGVSAQKANSYPCEKGVVGLGRDLVQNLKPIRTLLRDDSSYISAPQENYIRISRWSSALHR